MSHLAFPWLRGIFYRASILTFVLRFPPRNAHFLRDLLPVHSLSARTADSPTHGRLSGRFLSRCPHRLPSVLPARHHTLAQPAPSSFPSHVLSHLSPSFVLLFVCVQQPPQ